MNKQQSYAFFLSEWGKTLWRERVEYSIFKVTQDSMRSHYQMNVDTCGPRSGPSISMQRGGDPTRRTAQIGSQCKVWTLPKDSGITLTKSVTYSYWPQFIFEKFIQILGTDNQRGLTLTAEAIPLKFIQLLTIPLIPLRLSNLNWGIDQPACSTCF